MQRTANAARAAEGRSGDRAGISWSRGRRGADRRATPEVGAHRRDLFYGGQSHPRSPCRPCWRASKAWMISIYKTVRGLNVDINEDVRGVLDRLIASDEAIAEAQTEIHARELFASADQAGMTEAEYKAYTGKRRPFARSRRALTCSPS